MTKHVPLELRCDNHELTWDLWDVIAPYASRWRRITLGARLRTLQDLKVLYMERLERLVIFAYDAPISPNLSVLDFVVAPHLRHIGLTLDELQSARQLHIPVTWALTSLAIEAITPYSITHTLPLLQACAHSLQSLTLKIRYPLEGPEGSYPTSSSDTFAMKALTFLSLVDPACALLKHITAPLIQSLILSNVPTYGTQSLLGFLTRSQASRTLLELRVYIPAEQDPSAWIPCLQLMDSLTDLHFDDMLTNEEFLKRMVIRADERPLVPALGWINVAHIFNTHIELHEVLLDISGSRGKKVLLPDGRTAWQALGWFDD
ncbi:hypothetical protein GGG16DRAFT_114256 [Schizophyllum commune]